MKLVSRDLSGNWTIAAGLSPAQQTVTFEAVNAHGKLIPYATGVGAHDFASMIRMNTQDEEAHLLANRLQHAFDENSIWAY